MNSQTQYGITNPVRQQLHRTWKYLQSIQDASNQNAIEDAMSIIDSADLSIAESDDYEPLAELERRTR